MGNPADFSGDATVANGATVIEYGERTVCAASLAIGLCGRRRRGGS